MPKVVDHDARRRAIAQAAIEAISDVGIDAVTMGLVASRAGLTAGTLPHYYAGKRAVLLAALGAVIQSIRERATLATARGGLSPLSVCLGVVPCTPEQRREWKVWLAFAGRAAYDPELGAEFVARARQGSNDLARMLDALRRIGQFPADLDVITASEDLSTLLDGLGLRATLEPEAFPRSRLEACIRRELLRLGWAEPPTERDH